MISFNDLDIIDFSKFDSATLKDMGCPIDFARDFAGSSCIATLAGYVGEQQDNLFKITGDDAQIRWAMTTNGNTWYGEHDRDLEDVGAIEWRNEELRPA
jgi:hypothetical protein